MAADVRAGFPELTRRLELIELGFRSSLEIPLDAGDGTTLGSPRSVVLGGRKTVRRSALLLSIGLVIAVACGRSEEVAGQGNEELGLHLADSGQSVTLRVGDRLNLSLGSSSDRHWVITAFPRSLLIASAPGAGDFTFTALAPGRGRVVVVNTFACPPATLHGCSIPERGNGSSSSGVVPPGPPIFTVTVRVV